MSAIITMINHYQPSSPTINNCYNHHQPLLTTLNHHPQLLTILGTILGSRPFDPAPARACPSCPRPVVPSWRSSVGRINMAAGCLTRKLRPRRIWADPRWISARRSSNIQRLGHGWLGRTWVDGRCCWVDGGDGSLGVVEFQVCFGDGC